jgi:hypothetical protein
MSKFGCYWSGFPDVSAKITVFIFRFNKSGSCLCRDLSPTAEGPTAMKGYPNQGYCSRLLIYIAVRKFSIKSLILSFCSARKFYIDVEIHLSKIQMWALCGGFICFFQWDKLCVFVIHLPLRIQWTV